MPDEEVQTRLLLAPAHLPRHTLPPPLYIPLFLFLPLSLHFLLRPPRLPLRLARHLGGKRALVRYGITTCTGLVFICSFLLHFLFVRANSPR